MLSLLVLLFRWMAFQAFIIFIIDKVIELHRIKCFWKMSMKQVNNAHFEFIEEDRCSIFSIASIIVNDLSWISSDSSSNKWKNINVLNENSIPLLNNFHFDLNSFYTKKKNVEDITLSGVITYFVRTIQNWKSQLKW